MSIGKNGLSGSALKWIAIISMLIDHIGLVLLVRMLLNYQYEPELSLYDKSYAVLYDTMVAMRFIGRLAFPIFCFLLVEGFQRTKNKRKYVVRMGIFAVLSEIPFDLALAGRPVNWGYQNVMLTLWIGLLTMWACSLVEQYWGKRKYLFYLGFGVCSGMGMLLADLMNTDYGAKGIFCIMVLYFFRGNRLFQCFMGALSLVWEAEAMFSFVFVYFYNGQRGRQSKYFFYLFYPIHLLLAYFLCYLLKIHWIPVI